MGMIFILMRIKTHFHERGCALGLILKVRGFQFNWEVDYTIYFFTGFRMRPVIGDTIYTFH